jgi:hypothetical protein
VRKGKRRRGKERGGKGRRGRGEIKGRGKKGER